MVDISDSNTSTPREIVRQHSQAPPGCASALLVKNIMDHVIISQIIL